ncbi:MAG: TolC family protein [Planctomycetes bacterium]|nr:TolC family protein [Planctomycetota bacterium]
MAKSTASISSLLAFVCCAVAAAQQPAPQDPLAPKPTPPIAQDPTQKPDAPLPVDAEAERKSLPIRDLTLGDALRAGRANNVELRAAELLPQQARQDLLVAEAVFQPELYGDAGYSDAESPRRNNFQPALTRKTIDATVGWRQRVLTGGLFDLAYRPARLTTSSTSGAFPDRQYTSEWSLSYTQPLLRGAWTDYQLADVNSARHGLRQAEHSYARQIQDTLLAIVEAYWELAYARANYRVVLAALDVAREQLRITAERIRVQELAPRDRVADEAEVARREEERIQADNEIRRREDDLRRLVFDDAGGSLWRWNLRPSSPIETSPAVEEVAFEPFVEAALGKRPDLMARRNEVAQAELEAVKANRDTLPGLDLVTSYSSDGVRDDFSPAFADSSELQYPDWSVRLQFSIPIGNQAARARAQGALLEVERRQRVLYGAILDVTKEVRAAVRNLHTLAQSIRASGESVRLAETNLETEKVKLRVGASTAFEVQRRNQELREARSRHLRNQLDYRVAESRLQHAQGILEVPRE